MREIGYILDHPCPECGSRMVLRDSRFGLFYGCTSYPDCSATHGAHKATGEPLGIPADRPTKAARIEAHEVFDALWKGHRMTRERAYAWMAERLGLTAEEAHIGRFDIEQCKRLVEAVRQRGRV